MIHPAKRNSLFAKENMEIGKYVLQELEENFVSRLEECRSNKWEINLDYREFIDVVTLLLRILCTGRQIGPSSHSFLRCLLASQM